jgi:hypothetical protein
VTSDLVDVLPDRGCNQTRAVGYDHSDHVWGARFAREAIRRYDTLPNSQNQPTYFTYKGYNLEWNEPQPPTRLGTKDFCLKKGIFFNYAVHDGAATDFTDQAQYAPNNFDCYSDDYIGYQKGQQQQSP